MKPSCLKPSPSAMVSFAAAASNSLKVFGGAVIPAAAKAVLL